MFTSLLRLAILRLAQYFKGRDYQLDDFLPLSALLELSLRRGMCVIRCVLRGIEFNPRKLVFIDLGVELRNRKLIKFGKGVTLGRNVLINGLSREGVRLGNNVNIGPYTIIEASGSIVNLGKGIEIGDNSGIGGFSYIGGAGGVTIGKNVIMGQWVGFHPENHNFDSLDLPIRLQGVNRKGIVVEDDCWVGAKVTFLDGAYLGKGSVVAAGAVVKGRFPPYSIIGGVPAKLIRSREEKGKVQDA